MTNPIDRYTRKHGDAPKILAWNKPSKQRVVVRLHCGYVQIKVYGGGFPQSEIYITRPALIKILRWLVPKVKLMEGSFHVPSETRAYLEREEFLAAEIKRLKGADRRQRRRRKRASA